ncbi:hypothetical protein GGX14DRAFT_385667 [Mycena pura]|uniref:Uncharacterized protein n=1 Tax=Mycena pura TaxID=153505 RepID=A0AAD7E3L4_9AGAR|nr:hypothetical protein GGX14DRAFT_385667 [Mycena pura]
MAMSAASRIAAAALQAHGRAAHQGGADQCAAHHRDARPRGGVGHHRVRGSQCSQSIRLSAYSPTTRRRSMHLARSRVCVTLEQQERPDTSHRHDVCSERRARFPSLLSATRARAIARALLLTPHWQCPPAACCAPHALAVVPAACCRALPNCVAKNLPEPRLLTHWLHAALLLAPASRTAAPHTARTKQCSVSLIACGEEWDGIRSECVEHGAFGRGRGDAVVQRVPSVHVWSLRFMRAGTGAAVIDTAGGWKEQGIEGGNVGSMNRLDERGNEEVAARAVASAEKADMGDRISTRAECGSHELQASSLGLAPKLTNGCTRAGEVEAKKRLSVIRV